MLMVLILFHHPIAIVVLIPILRAMVSHHRILMVVMHLWYMELHLLAMMVGMLVSCHQAVMVVLLLHHIIWLVDMVLFLLSPLGRLNNVMKIVGTHVTIQEFTSRICHQM